jgi:prefoldin subunit 5
MDDDKTNKLLEDGARAVAELHRLDDALKSVIQNHEALIELQQEMTQSLRDLKEGAERIRKGCDAFNAEMERRGIGTAQQKSETVAIAPFLEGWTPPTDRVH